jgi:ribosomal protein S18 acetylase RimI-like enzyme
MEKSSMVGSLTISEFTDNETSAVASFFKKIFAEMNWGITLEDGLDKPGEYFYSQNGRLFLVKNAKQVVVGTSGLIRLDDKSLLLKRFYVDTPYRGHGIAQELLAKTIEEAKKMAYKSLLLDVNCENIQAIRFYEKNRFIKISAPIHENWWESQHPESYYYYQLTLS